MVANLSNHPLTFVMVVAYVVGWVQWHGHLVMVFLIQNTQARDTEATECSGATSRD